MNLEISETFYKRLFEFEEEALLEAVIAFHNGEKLTAVQEALVDLAKCFVRVEEERMKAACLKRGSSI